MRLLFTASSGSHSYGKEKSKTDSGYENGSWSLNVAHAKDGDLVR